MFSKTCEYSIRATVYIYNRYLQNEGNVSIDDIAEDIQSPRHFTAKILQTLSRQNIISSIKGPHGGFYLTERQGKMSLLELVRAIDGPRLLSGCLLGLEQCDELHPCPMHEQYKPLRDNLLELLNANTIENLAARLKKGQTFLNAFMQ